MLGRLLAGLRGLPWQNLNVLRSNRWLRNFAECGARVTAAVRVNRQHAEDKRETEEEDEEEEEEERELNAALRADGVKVKAAAEVSRKNDPELPESLKAAGTKLNLSHNWHTRVTDSIRPVHVVVSPTRHPSGPGSASPCRSSGAQPTAPASWIMPSDFVEVDECCAEGGKRRPEGRKWRREGQIDSSGNRDAYSRGSVHWPCDHFSYTVTYNVTCQGNYTINRVKCDWTRRGNKDPTGSGAVGSK